MKYTNEELLDVLRTEYKMTGKVPSSCVKRSINKNIFYNRFGSWNKALMEAGITPRVMGGREDKECLYCKIMFSTTVSAAHTFCSMSCAKDFRKRESINRKNEKSKVRNKRNVWKQEVKKQSEIRLMAVNFDDLSWDSQRKRVILEQSNKCNKCGLDEWFGQKLTLEVDHKNGDNTDNTRDNLEGLCPNCHSITPTWRGRNKACNKVTDDELIIALQKTTTIRQALMLVGMAAKGANYRRAKILRDSTNTNLHAGVTQLAE